MRKNSLITKSVLCFTLVVSSCSDQSKTQNKLDKIVKLGKDVVKTNVEDIKQNLIHQSNDNKTETKKQSENDENNVSNNLKKIKNDKTEKKNNDNCSFNDNKLYTYTPVIYNQNTTPMYISFEEYNTNVHFQFADYEDNQQAYRKNFDFKVPYDLCKQQILNCQNPELIFLAYKVAKENNIDPYYFISLIETESSFKVYESNGRYFGLGQIPYEIYSPEKNLEIAAKIFNEKLRIAHGNYRIATMYYKGFRYMTPRANELVNRVYRIYYAIRYEESKS